MQNEFDDVFQYNSCVSRGICSINPRTSALQSVLLSFIKISANYFKYFENDVEFKNFLLNTITITISNPDFNEHSFLFTINKFKDFFEKLFESEALKTEISENKKNNILNMLKDTSDIILSIKLGEKIFNNATDKISSEMRDMYNIILIIIKSLSLNLLELQCYDIYNNDIFELIISLLNTINLDNSNIDNLKNEIYNACKTDVNLMKLIRKTQENRYGIQIEKEVSFSTIPNKAVLVVGSNIKELETILEALKNEDIDIYTHDEMMLAYTFPKFSEYSRLKGQFGVGLENCLLDFATFPGPIILTKHSLHNIENFYRGRLFTTDYMTSPKGIIKIIDNDFSELIESAKKSKGFKKGKQCESVLEGFDYKKIVQQIKSKISLNNYKQIFLIGLDGYFLEQKTYFENLIKLLPKDILIISFSYKFENENIVYINACYDNFNLIKIFNFVKNYNLPITIFVPKCSRNTISQVIYLSEQNNVNVYLGKCTPIILNPSLINTMKSKFNIANISISKKDLEEILKDK